MTRPRAVRLEVFSVEDTTLQLSWGALGPGPVRAETGDRVVEVEPTGGPGRVVIDGLEPDTASEVVLTGPGVPGDRRVLPYRTVPSLPGPELYRFATIGDLHLGVAHFGLLERMHEKPVPDELHPVRCARAAIAEATAWGAQRIVAKGDITNRGEHVEWEQFAGLVAAATVPIDALPGNHEVRRNHEVAPDTALATVGLDPLEGIRSIDVPGLRIVLVDSTLPVVHHGQLDRTDEIVDDHVATAPGPVLIALHHQLERAPFRYFYPPGVRRSEAHRFLDAIVATGTPAFVTSGHTHRYRRFRHGPITVTEVGSTKDYPGGWAGYVVHESGIRQVVRRIADPACLDWIEYTRRAALTGWGHWSPGTIGDRCFTNPWPT